MSATRRNRLFDIEIDEVSSVDRPANQGGLITIAKAERETKRGLKVGAGIGAGIMAVRAPRTIPRATAAFRNLGLSGGRLGAAVAGGHAVGAGLSAAEGGAVGAGVGALQARRRKAREALASKSMEEAMADTEQMAFDIPDDVQHGDTVVAADGSEYVYLETGDDGEPLPLDGVDVADLVAASESVYDLSGEDGEYEPTGEGYEADVGKALPGFKPLAERVGNIGAARIMGRRAVGAATGYAEKNPLKAAGIAGSVGAGVGGAGAMATMKKSLGSTVLEELSKAVNDDERNRIVAKMADDQELLAAENEELRKAFEESEDARLTEAFIAKAAEYELPVDPETFGPILKAMVEVLDEDQIEVLDQVLASRGIPLDELGYAGGASNSGVLDEVSGLAAELVGKAAGGVTTEQAVTALFDHNPGGYDAYLAEQDGR